MSAAVETMMYVNATPWHGLGHKLDNPPTIAEALEQSGLNWGVTLEQLQLADGRAVDRYATVRSTDKRILGTVGPGFHPVQNATAFRFFQPFLDEGAATLETAGSLHKGSRVWMLAKIARPDSVIVPQADDRVQKFLLLAHGHDGSLSIHVSLTPIRVVCQNTLSASLNSTTQSTIKIRHTSGAESALKEVHATIERVDGDFERAADVFRALAGKSITSGAQLRAYVEAVFPSKVKEEPKAKGIDAVSFMEDLRREKDTDDLASELLGAVQERKSRVFDEVCELFEKGRGNDLPGVKGTAWGAYNAVTEYMTWERGNSADARLNNVWLRGNGMPQRALSAAVDNFL